MNIVCYREKRMAKVWQRIRNRLIIFRVKLLRRFHPLESDIVIGRGTVKTLQRILLCLPNRRTLVPDIQSFIGNLKQQHAGLAIDVFTPAESVGWYKNMPGTDRTIVRDETCFTSLGFPRKTVLAGLAANGYGMVIDFNQPLDLATSYLVYKLGTAFRLSIKNTHSFLFYNIEVVPHSASAIDMILKMLPILQRPD